MVSLGRVLRGARRRLGKPRGEAGFTLVEMLVAQGVILASLVTIAYTATVGFSDIALARQRQGANGLANRLMEQVRSLPFDVVKRGLSNTDLAGGDPAIVTSGCPNGSSYCYRSSPSADLEEIPRGANPTVEPLVPHQGTATVGPTTYSRAVYVTYYENDSTLNAFRVTAVVTWADPARRGRDAEVVVQSVFYSPTGVSTATHPFAAPRQPFLYGSAQNSAGTVSVSGEANGLGLASATLWMPAQASTMQIEQIASVQGSVTTSGLTLDDTTVGRESAASAADNDPAQPGTEYSTATAGGSSQVLSTGSGNALNLSLASGNTGSTTSTTYATSVNGCALQTDQQPCGTSTGAQAASISAGLTLAGGLLLNLGTANLASIASYRTTGTTDRVLDATGDGRIGVTAARTIGDVRIGGLPSGLGALLVPLGWQGYLVRLNGYSDTVSAQTGANTTAPGVTATGTLSVWNGLGYTNVTVNPGPGVTVPVTSLTIQDPLSPGGLLRVALSATVRTGGTTSTSTSKTCSPTPCVNTRTAAAASAASPVVVDLSFEVTHAGNDLVDVDVHVDLGTLQVSGTYQEAPSV
ncbi:MAG: prepilin-type N-terminal cleavage/methylation domain-containing protein [Actinomycetota bacterium]